MIANLNKVRKGYITLLSSEDYLKAVLVLNESLKRVNSKYPLICALLKSLNKDKITIPLQKAGVIIDFIDEIDYSKQTIQKYKGKRVLKTASKLQLFKLDYYDKLIYIDADTLVISNIDDLFEKPDGAILKLENDFLGMSSLFVFIPKNHCYEYYNIIKENTESFDGDIIGKIFFPLRDNLNYKISEEYCKEYNENDLYLEINANGKDKYPRIEFWNIVKEYKDAKIIIGSDAHKIEDFHGENVKRVMEFAKALSLNIQEKMVLKEHKQVIQK